MFQSLFCWKFLLGYSAVERFAAITSGFNPCFVGSSSQAEKNREHLGNRTPRFNPCFVGSSSQARLLFLKNRRQKGGVSILVLLEVPLRPEIQKWKEKVQQCFNPCFVGSSSQASQCQKGTRKRIAFQSLFCWKFLLGRRTERDSGRNSGSFNPCFVGSSSQARPDRRHGIPAGQFQSLFCWKFLLGSCSGR